MRIAHLDFRPRLIPSLVFVLLLALLLGLGLWQVQRAGEKEALLEEREQRAGEAPLDLNRLRSVAPQDRFRRAAVTGRYAGKRQWLLDNRVVEGRAGYHVYSLFEPAEGREPLVLVNRGWVEVGESRQFLPELPVPEGEVTITGRLDRPESVGIRMGDAQLGSLARLIVVPYLDMEALEQSLGRRLYRFALVLDEHQPGLLRRDWMRSEQITPEKHLGYAVQWFALAVALSIIYFGVNSRRINREMDRD